MIKILQENISAIIGVFGTMSGIILGFLLHQIVRIGKIKIYQNAVDFKLYKRGLSGSWEQVNDPTDNIIHLTITCEIDVLNTSDYSKQIMRDIKLKIRNKSISKKYPLSDQKTLDFTGYSFNIDKLQNINLNPRELRNLDLSATFDKNFEFILNSDWFLEYKNLKNKTITIKLKKRTTTRLVSNQPESDKVPMKWINKK